MNVLFCSSEVAPFAKTGGLADVSGALPKALEKRGVNIKISMPFYKDIKPERTSPVSSSIIGENIETIFIENDGYFNRDGLYGDSKGDHPDNLDRFSFFCRKTLEVCKKIGFKPDIIHCNDWQTALIPVYLKSIYKDDNFFKYTKTIFTIHNIAYQGLFGAKEFAKIGIDQSLFSIKGLEFNGKLNILKGGLVFSDQLSTVSPTYAKEIQTREYGFGLEGVVFERRHSLYGILNGLDYDVWDPAKDNLIQKKYSSNNLFGKLKNKEKLQEQSDFTIDKSIPLLGMISRLAQQKGMDLLLEAIDELMKLNVQLIILGTGDELYHTLLEKETERYSDKMSVNLKFDEKLAHNIYAASDLLLMPSHYEPCGLGQMIGFKYGAIPLVFKTGGLADTVEDFDQMYGCGNGFVFDKYTPSAFIDTVTRAIDAFRIKELWKPLLERGFSYNFSWEESAKHYFSLYKRLMHNET